MKSEFLPCFLEFMKNEQKNIFFTSRYIPFLLIILVKSVFEHGKGEISLIYVCILSFSRHYCLCWSCSDFPSCQLCAEATGLIIFSLQFQCMMQCTTDASLFPRLPDRQGAIWGLFWQFQSIWFFFHTFYLSMNPIH